MGKPDRLWFLDNVRYFIIAFVILQHVALLYRVYGSEPDIAQYLFEFIVGITDIFMMPVMFFIAGFFALSSIRRKGAATFLAGKVRRIWLPWLTGVTFIVPPSVFLMRFAASGELSGDYLSFWLRWMRSSVRFHTGFVTGADSFSHRHLWFLSVLFLFFVVFSIIYTLAGKMRGGVSHGRDKPEYESTSFTMPLIWTGILSMAGFFGIKLFFRWGYQATQILGLVHFDPSRLPLFAVYFIFGVYASAGRWFENERLPDRFGIWIAVSILAFIVFSWTTLSGSIELTLWIKFLLSVLRSVLTLSLFVVIVFLSQHRWNSGSSLNRLFASNSYTVYIIHYLVLAGVGTLLVQWNTHLLVKTAVIYVLTFAASYVLAEYAVKRYPKLSLSVLVVVNSVMFVVL